MKTYGAPSKAYWTVKNFIQFSRSITTIIEKLTLRVPIYSVYTEINFLRVPSNLSNHTTAHDN